MKKKIVSMTSVYKRAFICMTITILTVMLYTNSVSATEAGENIPYWQLGCYHEDISTVTKKATPTEEGLMVTKCTKCGREYDKVIKSPGFWWEDNDVVYEYTGKKIKQPFRLWDRTFEDIDGFPKSDYKVTYKNNKKVGTATVKVTLNSEYYEGSYIKKYAINPVLPNISMGATGSNRVTEKYRVNRRAKVQWSKYPKHITGFQIQYATNKKFKKPKSVWVKNRKLKAKEFKLKDGKKYYIRVRTYTKVKENGKNKKYYSKWSWIYECR